MPLKKILHCGLYFDGETYVPNKRRQELLKKTEARAN